MEIDAQYLRERYSAMETEELLHLERDGNLTEIAASVLREILQSRGVTEEMRSKLVAPRVEANSPGTVIPPPEGVGGWLLLLVAGMLVIGPLMAIGRLNFDFLQAERAYGHLNGVPEWLLFKKLSWATLLAFVAISIYGGLNLLRKRTCNVVAQAIAVIWITGPVGLLVMGGVIPFLAFGKFDLTEAGFFGSMLGSIIGSSAWTAYLLLSRRVKATYCTP